MENKPHIVIAGAGALGCFIGGLLAANGRRVTLILRPHVAAEIRAHGLTLTDFSGLAKRVSADDLTLSEDAACMQDADIVLIAAKSDDTPSIGRIIAAHAPITASVVSLQNGTQNFEILRDLLPGSDLRAGLVAFHVVPKGQGCFHRETNGEIFIGSGPGDLAATLATAHLIVSEVEDITNLQWGRFVINLNEALNALSGLPLRQQLENRNWRKVIAAQWAEALRVLKAAGIAPVLGTSTPIGLIPSAMRLPTPIFARAAGAMLNMDEQARSLMAHDLMLGNPTEVLAFQGLVVQMGVATGTPTPLNMRVLELVKLAEMAAEGLPNLPVSAIRSNG